jgi:hypothetical protein
MDIEQLAQIAEDLDTALRALKWTKSMAETAKLNETHNALYASICNAFNSVQQVINHVNNEPNTEKPTNQRVSP